MVWALLLTSLFRAVRRSSNHTHPHLVDLKTPGWRTILSLLACALHNQLALASVQAYLLDSVCVHQSQAPALMLGVQLYQPCSIDSSCTWPPVYSLQ